VGVTATADIIKLAVSLCEIVFEMADCCQNLHITPTAFDSFETQPGFFTFPYAVDGTVKFTPDDEFHREMDKILNFERYCNDETIGISCAEPFPLCDRFIANKKSEGSPEKFGVSLSDLDEKTSPAQEAHDLEGRRMLAEIWHLCNSESVESFEDCSLREETCAQCEILPLSSLLSMGTKNYCDGIFYYSETSNVIEYNDQRETECAHGE
jgi:hypothetical protein